MDKYITRLFVILLLPCCVLVLSAGEVFGAKTSPMYEQVLEKLTQLTPGAFIEVRIGTAKQKYEIDEPFEVRFQSNKDCYFVLMHIDADGNITFLAPSAVIPDNRMKADRVYSTGATVPLASDQKELYDFGMRITASPPRGYETINLFCSVERIDLFKVDFDNEPLYSITPNDEEKLQSLLSRLDQLQKFDWSGTSVTYKVGEVRAVPRKHGGLKPIGSTGTTGKWFPPVGSTGTTGKQ